MDGKYKIIDFLFEPVADRNHNGPIQFKIEKVNDLDSYFTYLKSWLVCQITKEKGVQLLTDDVEDKFTSAWNEDGEIKKTISLPKELKVK